mmetsp:Transcript_15707/g.46857  ORF Transcript_15707/g.46857 Transcript_15707/m.46857 type:complete len:123 (-) Transcript_15707:37-405(-)
MAARIIPLVAVAGGSVAAAWTLRECAKAGASVAERCVTCTFAAGGFGATALLLYMKSDTYADRVADANKESEARSAAVIDEALKREEERYRRYSEELARTAAKRRAEAEKLDVYVDPRDRHD